MGPIARLILGIYNILTTYLVGWVLLLASLAFGFHVGTELVVDWLGFAQVDLFWQWVGASTGIEAVYWRIAVYGPLHALVVYLAWEPLQWLKSRFEALFDVVIGAFRGATDEGSRLAAAGRLGFTAAVTLVLVPFVIQPTLVRGYTEADDWLHRSANLVDGTASRFLVDSVAGAYRRFVVGDVDSRGGLGDDDVSQDDSEGPSDPPDPSGDRPMMDRWDPTIRAIADGDPEMFAYIKAFMWVESGGRQFAVSHTGCSGLMQFCSGTARRSPFRRVFGTGSVYTCGCGPDCHTPDDVERALETGRRDEIQNLDEKFPCDLSDARFDGEKSLKAGALYIERLARDYDDNLYLMYIGYNSGPAVADKVWRATGRDPSAGLDRIGQHLAGAMEEFFPQSHDTRANSLLETHLPKLQRAYDRYYEAKHASLYDPGQRRLERSFSTFRFHLSNSLSPPSDADRIHTSRHRSASRRRLTRYDASQNSIRRRLTPREPTSKHHPRADRIRVNRACTPGGPVDMIRPF
jgi:hypothetical protein